MLTRICRYLTVPAALLMLIVMVACNSANNNTNGYEDAVVTLDRTQCGFGTCPSYTITLYGNGRIVYNGDWNVAETGRRRAKIDPQQVHDLIDFMLDGGFMLLDGSYTAQAVSDQSTASTTLEISGTTKTIAHYYGTSLLVPLVLHQIEHRIDIVANSEQWVGKLPASQLWISGEVIVHSAEEVTLPQGASMIVRLEEISPADANSIVVAEEVYTSSTKVRPFYMFTLALDELNTRATYTVSAQITDVQGSLLYTTDSIYNVLTNDAGYSADIELVSVK